MYEYMRQSDYWRLTLSHWPKAVEAGVRPCLPPKLSNYYKPTDIDFAHPPTRADFLQVCRQTPWMSTFESSGLLEIIEKNNWPMIDTAHKGSTVELFNEQDLVCGELRVWRHSAFQNKRYQVPMITVATWDKIVNRLPADKRDGTNIIRCRVENMIQERMLLADDISEDRMKYEIRLVLHEQGYLKTKPKKPVKESDTGK